MKQQDQIMYAVSSLFNSPDEQCIKPTKSSFEQVFKKCELKWQAKKCKSGNLYKKICTDDQCKNDVFICDLQNCKSCFQNHKRCYMVRLGAFAQQLGKIIDYQKTFFKKLYLIDQELIEKISHSRFQLAKKISSGSLDQQYSNILDLILVKQQAQNIEGKQTHKLFQRLRKKFKEDSKNQQFLEQIFSKRSIQMVEENGKLKNLIFQNFLKGSNPALPEIVQEKYFLASPLLQVCLNQLYMNSPGFYQKRICNNLGFLAYPDSQKRAFDRESLSFLKQQLGNPIKAELIFLASQHNFLAAKFHEKCDGKANTLTIIRTQFRKTIFAFAAQAWVSNGSYVNDGTSKSCIIWLDPRKKLTLANAAYSIYGSASHGPSFGNGQDILIQNGATGTTAFPNAYNNGLGGASQANYTLMCGNPSGNSFKVLEYEVYQLSF